MPLPDDSFRRRLRLIMQQFGSIADLAKAVQVSDNAIYKWVAGRGQPSMTSLVNLAQAAGVSVEWLATGSGLSTLAGPPAPAIASSDAPEVIAIPRRRVAELPPQIQPVSFSPAWLRARFALAPADTALIEIAGDSMTPGLNHGDFALIDQRRRRFDHDALYALSINDEVSIRRLQRADRNTLLICSDNPAYKTIPVPFDDIDVAGRVIMVCRCAD